VQGRVSFSDKSAYVRVAIETFKQKRCTTIHPTLSFTLLTAFSLGAAFGTSGNETLGTVARRVGLCRVAEIVHAAVESDQLASVLPPEETP
jgi:hypothetical protein